MQRNAEEYRETRSLVREIRFRQGSSWQPWRRTGYTFEASEEEAFELEEDEAVVAVRSSTNGWFGLVWFGGDHQHWKKGLMGKILGIWSEAECGGECKTWILLWVDGSE